MAMQKNPQTTLQEDFASIGISYQGQDLSGTTPAKLEPKKTKTEDQDPLDGKYVTNELFDRIMGLPFNAMNEEDIQELIEALKEKSLPPNASNELIERAEKVVKTLISEVAAAKQPRRKVTRRRQGGKMSRKRSILCARGLRMVKGRCVRSATAAGGAGELARERRKKRLWTRGGKGKVSKRKSLRMAKRAAAGKAEEFVSPFALELGYLLEETKHENYDVRDEIMERIDNILVMLSEEFLDSSVTEIFSESFDKILESWDAGRMDEDVVPDEEFVATIKPVLTVITKSLDRLDRQDRGELGNV